jgi:predicted DNA-binding ribbon-helix-helix protein
MKRISIDINDEEYAQLKRIAEWREVSVATLLGYFVQDLTDSDRRGGSDEHYRALDWLDRVMFKYR